MIFHNFTKIELFALFAVFRVSGPSHLGPRREPESPIPRRLPYSAGEEARSGLLRKLSREAGCAPPTPTWREISFMQAFSQFFAIVCLPAASAETVFPLKFSRFAVVLKHSFPIVFQGFRKPCKTRSRASGDTMGACATAKKSLIFLRVSLVLRPT